MEREQAVKLMGCAEDYTRTARAFVSSVIERYEPAQTNHMVALLAHLNTVVEQCRLFKDKFGSTGPYKEDSNVG